LLRLSNLRFACMIEKKKSTLWSMHAPIMLLAACSQGLIGAWIAGPDHSSAWRRQPCLTGITTGKTACQAYYRCSHTPASACHVASVLNTLFFCQHTFSPFPTAVCAQHRNGMTAGRTQKATTGVTASEPSS
jgi:hypothetical protein